MPGDALTLVLFADRVGLNIASLLVIGLALHVALGVVERGPVWPGRWLALSACIGVLVFVGLRLVILNAQLGDGTTLFDPDLFRLSWTALGPSTMALGASALLSLTGILAGSRILAGIGAASLAVGFGLTGHTQGLADPGQIPLMVIAHVFFAGFWIVAPITLYPVGKLSDAALLARLKRFSALALVAIPLMIALGVWLAWILAGGFELLVSTPYGQLLLLKLAAALGAIGLGALNKQVVTSRMDTDPATGRRWLRLTLALDAVLFTVAVLAVSTATTLTGPGE